jgi:hypothetical protein
MHSFFHRKNVAARSDKLTPRNAFIFGKNAAAIPDKLTPCYAFFFFRKMQLHDQT